jgi:ribosomal protein S8E
MLKFILHNKTAWADYFTGNPTSTFSNLYEARQTPSDTNAHILNSLFRTITSTSSGGALYCDPVSCLLIESTSFFACKTSSGNGGAICFSNTGSGQCVFNKMCGYDCCLTSGLRGQFSYTYVRNDAISKNNINYSSITRCVNEISDTLYTLAHYKGKQCYTSINISNNKCGYRSGIYFCPLSDSNTITGSFLYSTFADNIATSNTCICFGTSGAKYEIRSCNILRNTQVSLGSEGTFATWGYLNINDSCILENTATNNFYTSSTSYTVTLSNCTVDKTTSNGNLITKNIVTKSFILALNHMSTHNCYSEYDSAGTLTPIMQTPSSSKKQRLYCSCEKFFIQSRLSDVVLLTNFLIFNFVHPYASSVLC